MKTIPIFLLSLAIVLLFGVTPTQAGCIFYCSTTELKGRVREHLNMSSSTPVNPETIREAIVSDLPLGSSREEVYEFLEERGFGQDPLLNRCDTSEKTGYVHCAIRHNVDIFSIEVFRIWTYDLKFVINEEGYLEEVETWSTGA